MIRRPVGAAVSCLGSRSEALTERVATRVFARVARWPLQQGESGDVGAKCET